MGLATGVALAGEPVAFGPADGFGVEVAVGDVVAVGVSVVASPPAGGVIWTASPPEGGVGVRKPGPLPRLLPAVTTATLVLAVMPPGTSGELQAATNSKDTAADTRHHRRFNRMLLLPRADFAGKGSIPLASAAARSPSSAMLC